jgi:hypothetical protein
MIGMRTRILSTRDLLKEWRMDANKPLINPLPGPLLVDRWFSSQLFANTANLT